MSGMKELLFATGNARKIAEANTALASYEIEVRPVKVDIDEIQHRDPAVITKAKARAAYAVIQQPVVVADTSWEVPALRGFPGGYMKDIAAWFAPEDWLSLMAPHKDKTIYCHEHVAYFDGTELQHFMASYQGRFTSEGRGTVAPHESFVTVVSFNENQTMAQQLERRDDAFASTHSDHWQQFGRWYAKY